MIGIVGEYRRLDEERRVRMEMMAGVGGGLVLVLAAAVFVRRRLRRRPRTLAGRWAVHNGYVYRRDRRVHLFVQGPPFDRGDGVVERALLVGSCAGRPSLITHFGWYRGQPGRIIGSGVALVLELPGEVAPPLQVDACADAADDAEFDEAYRVWCESPELVRAVLTPRARRVLTGGERVNVRLDGTAMVVWVDGELRSARQLATVHDLGTELYRLIPESVWVVREPPEEVPVQRAPDPEPDGVRAVDVHGRPGEASQCDGEVSVSVTMPAAWPRLTVVAYEWMADQYHAVTFDRPDPSAYRLVDIMFAVRSADDNFRRAVLADLAEWLPLDERNRRCGMVLEADRVTAHAPGELANDTLVTLLADVVHEIVTRLSEDTVRYRPDKLAAY
ncbi:hypothetical protein [Actinophytocola gossypii]|uniref:Uncharacterized protein n=1 Tax=Actinophytocola gossypii TaxID=2812003 RepID=A0ABT2JBF7_9PSEU|nr:hypothetical protein [Actinophytocola gossypii]MCT2585209.1 hypothetical protein [Actinophytocola gossypii]